MLFSYKLSYSLSIFCHIFLFNLPSAYNDSLKNIFDQLPFLEIGLSRETIVWLKVLIKVHLRLLGLINKELLEGGIGSSQTSLKFQLMAVLRGVLPGGEGGSYQSFCLTKQFYLL